MMSAHAAGCSEHKIAVSSPRKLLHSIKLSGRQRLATHPVAQVGVRSVLLVEPVFPLHHHAQVLVVHDETLHI